MNRIVWSTAAILLVVTLNSARATDPYPIDALSNVKARWTEAASRIETMHATIKQIEYDDVFRTVKRSEGTLDFERPNHFRIELRPVNHAATQSIKREGIDYTLERSSPLTIVCNANGIAWFDPDGAPFIATPVQPDTGSDSETTEETVAGDRPIYEANLFWDLMMALFGPDSDIPEPMHNQPASLEWSTIPVRSPQYDLPITLLNWPLFVTTPDAIAEQGFNLVEKNVRPKGVSAVPTDEVSSWFGIERINIQIDPVTSLPYATQTVLAGRTIVRFLDDVQLNPTFDRNDLFEPPADKVPWAQTTAVDRPE
jgi:hypothetical protein